MKNLLFCILVLVPPVNLCLVDSPGTLCSEFKEQSFDTLIQDFHVYRGVVHVALPDGEDVFFDREGNQIKRLRLRKNALDFVTAYPPNVYSLVRTPSDPLDSSQLRRSEDTFLGNSEVQLFDWQSDSLIFQSEVEGRISRVEFEPTAGIIAIAVSSADSTRIRLWRYARREVLFETGVTEGFIELFLSEDTLFLLGNRRLQVYAAKDTSYHLIRTCDLPERVDWTNLQLCFDPVGNSPIAFSDSTEGNVGLLRYVKLSQKARSHSSDSISFFDSSCPGVLDCERMHYYQVCENFEFRVIDIEMGVILLTGDARQLVGNGFPSLIFPLGEGKFVTGVGEANGDCRRLRFFRLAPY